MTFQLLKYLIFLEYFVFLEIRDRLRGLVRIIDRNYILIFLLNKKLEAAKKVEAVAKGNFFRATLLRLWPTDRPRVPL